ncbi:hypothetical protein SAMN04488011_10668 [Palleronia pelagia]|uniref:Uncharacterized protein n=2 Tax=Palleronia pelagia TaxID=387096 RepID=A0A1H8J5R2_9RHOB|nr:hypothetical protein SAMN04488011_10668 [Palleronia pelagia]
MSRERDEVMPIEHFHSVLVGYLMHWHRLSLDASLFFATASLTLTAVALSNSNLASERALTVSFMLIMIAVAGGVVTKTIMRQMMALRSAIQKLDEAGGAFSTGAHLKCSTVYPMHWKVPAEKTWHDPIKPIVLASTVLLPLALACMIIASALGLIEMIAIAL